MKRIYLFSISLLVLLLLNTLPIRADVLGPYIAEGNTPDIRVGYGRIVCVMQSTLPVTGSVTIRDEKGIQKVGVADHVDLGIRRAGYAVVFLLIFGSIYIWPPQSKSFLRRYFLPD